MPSTYQGEIAESEDPYKDITPDFGYFTDPYKVRVGEIVPDSESEDPYKDCHPDFPKKYSYEDLVPYKR